LAAMQKDGYEPATIECLLAYASQRSEDEERNPLFALGSVWLAPPSEEDRDEHQPCVPYLISDIVRIHGDRPWNNWRGDYRFLAVRKP
jgi:hypothetical protein